MPMPLRSQGKLKFLLLGNHVNYELNPLAACQKELELKRKPFFFLESRKLYFLAGRLRAQAKQKPQEIKLVQTQTGIGWVQETDHLGFGLYSWDYMYNIQSNLHQRQQQV